jgi:hypothetical protein
MHAYFLGPIDRVSLLTKTSERLQSFGEVIGCDEGVEMHPKLFMAFVVISLDGRFLRAVHAFDLAIGPRMIVLGQPMFDAILPA